MDLSSAFFWWLVIGGVTGWFASLVAPSAGKQYLYVDTLLGVVGALTASVLVQKWLAHFFGEYTLVVTIVAAFVGACALLAVWRLVLWRVRPTPRVS